MYTHMYIYICHLAPQTHRPFQCPLQTEGLRELVWDACSSQGLQFLCGLTVFCSACVLLLYFPFKGACVLLRQFFSLRGPFSCGLTRGCMVRNYQSSQGAHVSCGLRVFFVLVCLVAVLVVILCSVLFVAYCLTWNQEQTTPHQSIAMKQPLHESTRNKIAGHTFLAIYNMLLIRTFFHSSCFQQHVVIETTVNTSKSGAETSGLLWLIRAWQNKRWNYGRFCSGDSRVKWLCSRFRMHASWCHISKGSQAPFGQTYII